MAEVLSEDAGVGRLPCQSREALAEWRSSEQVENGTPSTSPLYSDVDGDGGLKPTELYEKYTWKIEEFSKIKKKELRSNAFEVGGYKWYILIYPQGCDVCNHLSLFLCVANHDKLLPGWRHFAQFTIAVMNKDPKKSKYSDTLHRFWKKEHDWGWKKFMELNKIKDGFIDYDTLTIEAQIQVIREKADRPFRCLDHQYRRELIRVYLTNVEQICHRFVEEKRSKLGRLIEDKARWSSFCAFWTEIDPNTKRSMSREKFDVILKVVVKHFFMEKEVTSTLVMDSLYSGLKALEGLAYRKKSRGILLDAEEKPASIVSVEEDMFVLVDDVLVLLEQVVLENLPPKYEKGPQNRTKDGNCGEDFNKEVIERDERRLMELGRHTVEIFVLGHIFSNNIEVAYQEAVALKRQEDLILEEEAAWLAESQQKSRRAPEKSKKKQGKQKRNQRKRKEKGKEEKGGDAVQDQNKKENSGQEIKDNVSGNVETAKGKPMLEGTYDVSDSVDGASEVLQPDSDDRDVSPVNWDTDASEVPCTEAKGREISSLLSLANGVGEKMNDQILDDSSSTCSSDSVPSVLTSCSYKGNCCSDYPNQEQPSRGRNRRGKEAYASTPVIEIGDQASINKLDAGDHKNISESSKAGESESKMLHVPKKLPDYHPVKKEEVLLQKKPSLEDALDLEQHQRNTAAVASSLPSPPANPSSTVQASSDNIFNIPNVDLAPAKKAFSNGLQPDHGTCLSMPSQNRGLRKSKIQRPAASKPMGKPVAQPVPVISKSSSAPLNPPLPVPSAVSMVQPAPVQARDVSPPSKKYIPRAYQNTILNNPIGSSGVTNPSSPNSGVNLSLEHMQPPTLVSALPFLPQSSKMLEPNSVESGFSFAAANQSGPQWTQCTQGSIDQSLRHNSPFLPRNIQNVANSSEQTSINFGASMPGCQTQSLLTDEFPHLDIINDLLEEEHVGKAMRPGNAFPSVCSMPHLLNRRYAYLGNTLISTEPGSCRFERSRSYHEDSLLLHQAYGHGQFDPVREFSPSTAPLPYANGPVEVSVPSHWQIGDPNLSLMAARNLEDDSYRYLCPGYSIMAHGVGGCSLFRPSNGH